MGSSPASASSLLGVFPGGGGCGVKAAVQPRVGVCSTCGDSRSKSWGLLLSSEAVPGWGRWEPLLSFSWGLSGRGQRRHQKARVGPGHPPAVWGLGVLRPRPVLLLPLNLRSQTPALLSLGSPIPSWGTPTPDSHRSANASETDFLQRCMGGSGKGQVPWCLDRSLGGRPW